MRHHRLALWLSALSFIALAASVVSAADTTPDAFSFTAQTAMPLSTVIVSNPITVTGIDTDAAISITGGEYAISTDGGVTWGGWSSSGTVSLNNQVKVHQTSSAANSTKTTATLTIGGVSADFDVTTAAPGDPNASGLIAWWKAEDNAYDSVGGHHGTMQNGATFAGGRDGRAFSFDATDDYVDAGTNDVFNFSNGTGAMTISTWIRVSSMPAFAYGLVSKASHGPGGQFTGPYSGWSFYLYSNGRIGFGGAGVWEFYSPASTVSTASWYHVAVTKAAGIYRIYCNGVEVASETSGAHASLETSTSTMVIGASYPDDSFFSGMIDDVRIYNRALSAAEVVAVAGPLPAAALRLWLKADAGVTKDGSNLVSNWADRSGNGFDVGQGTAAKQPLLVAGACNGLPAIRFDGTDDYLQTAAAVNLVQGTAKYTMFVVTKPGATQKSCADIVDYSHSGSVNFVMQQNVDATNQFGFINWQTLSSTAYQVFTDVYDNNISYTSYLNGINGVQSTSFSAISWTEPSFFSVGSKSLEAFARQFNGDVAEVIVYNTPLSDTDRRKVEDYLIGKYGIAITPTDIALSASTVNEHLASGTTVGTLTTTDRNVGDTFTYTLATGTGDTDNASFTIGGANLQTAASFDFETKSSYSIRVRTTDQGGLWFEKQFTVSVTNVNETPTDLALSSNSVAENQPSGTVVGALSSTDPDAGNTFTYTLVSGTGSTDNASFTISGANLQTAASFDFETKSSYSIRVRTTDQGGLFTEKEFAISVTNVNETPTDLALSNASIAENQPGGTVVGAFSSTDPDAGNTFTYTLVAGAGSTDNASFAIGGANLQTAASFDSEAKNSYNIRVRTTDQGGLFTEKAFTIQVTNVNESPTALASASPTSGKASLAVAFSGTGTDPENGVLTYAWTFGDGSTSAERNPSHTFLSAGTYTATLTVTDSGGLSATSSVVITVEAGGGALPGDKDSDGDGFWDEIEKVLGSNPEDPSDTPLDLAQPTNVSELAVSKMSIKLNFASPQSDSLGISGTLPVPAGFSAKGQTVLVDIGGIVRSFVLDEKGGSPKGSDAFKVAFKAKKGVVAAQTAKFALKLTKADLAADLADVGLEDADLSAPVSVPVALYFNGQMFQKNVGLSYKAKQGKTGSAK
jgi:PKD repeat protein